MHQGREAESYQARALLTGIFNRLGGEKARAIECKPPAWTRPAKPRPTSAAEIGLARDTFLASIGKGGAT